MQDAHAIAVELREFLFRLGVGSRINYGGNYGFQSNHQTEAVTLNKTASQLVGALVIENKAAALKLLAVLEGDIQIAGTTSIIAMPDVEKSFTMLDNISALLN